MVAVLERAPFPQWRWGCRHMSRSRGSLNQLSSEGSLTFGSVGDVASPTARGGRQQKRGPTPEGGPPGVGSSTDHISSMFSHTRRRRQHRRQRVQTRATTEPWVRSRHRRRPPSRGWNGPGFAPGGISPQQDPPPGRPAVTPATRRTTRRAHRLAQEGCQSPCWPARGKAAVVGG